MLSFIKDREVKPTEYKLSVTPKSSISLISQQILSNSSSMSFLGQDLVAEKLTLGSLDF